MILWASLELIHWFISSLSESFISSSSYKIETTSALHFLHFISAYGKFYKHSLFLLLVGCIPKQTLHNPEAIVKKVELYYLCIDHILSPEMADFILATHIPHSETQVFKPHPLYVKSNCWNGSHILTKFEFVQNCGLPC